MKLLQIGFVILASLSLSTFAKNPVLTSSLPALAESMVGEKVLLRCLPGAMGAPFRELKILREMKTGVIKTSAMTREGDEFLENSNEFEWQVKDLTFPNVENKAYRLRLSSEGPNWTLVEYTIDNLEYYYEVSCAKSPL